MSNQIRRRDLMAMAASAAITGNAWTQTTPSPTGKIVKILVGFPPGQATDTTTRILAERLSTATGDNYIVDNRPGQGGSLALGQLAKAPADGSVMMMAHMSAVATNPHLYKSVPYNSLKDFESAGLIADLPFVLVCNPSVPASNLAELIQYARANPGKLTNASSGNGTVSHLAMEELKRAAGLQITHVPYQGSARGLTDVIAGNVSLALETAASVQPHVQSGKLRALGAGSSRRLGGVLAVPTIAEQGFPGFSAVTWLMLLYPANTPRPIINTTFSTVARITRTADFEQRLSALGVLPRFSTSPEEATAYLRSEFKHWGDVVKRSAVTLE